MKRLLAASIIAAFALSVGLAGCKSRGGKVADTEHANPPGKVMPDMSPKGR